MGSLLRAGLSLGIGATNPKPLPRDRNDYALWKSEIKLIFEEIRRRIAPDAVSRLNCLYLADNIEVIKGIPEFDPKAPIIKVRIRENSWVTKAHMNWLADTADIQATEAKFAWHCFKAVSKNHLNSMPSHPKPFSLEPPIKNRGIVSEAISIGTVRVSVRSCLRLILS